MPVEFTTSYLKDALGIFRTYKNLAERAMAQVTDEQLFVCLDPESNSIALIVKHIAGNMRSRWTGFLTTDGEKPDRDRDSEFVAPPTTREGVMGVWEEGWRRVFGALELLNQSDMSREVYIRGEKHSVLQAIQRQIAHYSYHSGQIVMLAKHFRSAQWKTLSMPRNRHV